MPSLENWEGGVDCTSEDGGEKGGDDTASIDGEVEEREEVAQ